MKQPESLCSPYSRTARGVVNASFCCRARKFHDCGGSVTLVLELYTSKLGVRSVFGLYGIQC